MNFSIITFMLVLNKCYLKEFIFTHKLIFQWILLHLMLSIYSL